MPDGLTLQEFLMQDTAIADKMHTEALAMRTKREKIEKANEKAASEKKEKEKNSQAMEIEKPVEKVSKSTLFAPNPVKQQKNVQEKEKNEIERPRESLTPPLHEERVWHEGESDDVWKTVYIEAAKEGMESTNASAEKYFASFDPSVKKKCTKARMNFFSFSIVFLRGNDNYEFTSYFIFVNNSS